MGSLSLRIPDSYHTAVKEIATQDNISINQFIVFALSLGFFEKTLFIFVFACTNVL